METEIYVTQQDIAEKTIQFVKMYIELYKARKENHNALWNQ